MLLTGFWTDFASSVWIFCHWAADVPPCETSLSGEEKRLPFAGYKTARDYHLDFTGCEKSRDKIRYHCLFWSPSQAKVITFETHPLHPWMRFSEELDRGGWGGGSLSLWGLLKLTHWHSLQTHWKPLLKNPYKYSQHFLKRNGEHLPKTNTEIWALPHGDLTSLRGSSYWQYCLRKCMWEWLEGDT